MFFGKSSPEHFDLPIRLMIAGIHGNMGCCRIAVKSPGFIQGRRRQFPGDGIHFRGADISQIPGNIRENQIPILKFIAAEPERYGKNSCIGFQLPCKKFAAAVGKKFDLLFPVKKGKGLFSGKDFPAEGENIPVIGPFLPVKHHFQKEPSLPKIFDF